MEFRNPPCRHPTRSIALASLAIGLVGALLIPRDSSAAAITVYLLGGQSNAAGLADGADLSGVLAAPQSDVLLYHGKDDGTIPSDVWLPLQPGSNSGNRFGPEVSFGRTMSDATGSASNSVAIVKDALGGTSLASDWSAGGDGTTAGDGPQYQQFQATVDAALDDLALWNPLDDIILGGMFWMQGESDTTPSGAAAYASNLEDFIDDIRLTYGSDLPFSIGRLSIEQTVLDAANLQIVRDAQTAVAAADPLTGMVDTDLFSIGPDALHFDASGQVALGEAFALSLLAIPEPSTGPLLLIGVALLSLRSRGNRTRRCVQDLLNTRCRSHRWRAC